MNIIRYKDAPLRKEKDFRRYYLPPQDPLEIIETIIPSGVSQTLHIHKLVREAMLVLEGTVIVAEIVSGVRKEYELNAGDFAVFNPGSCHMMSNQSNASARTLTFKFLGVKKNSKLFATDKIEECTGLIKSTEGNLTQNKRI